MLNTDDIKMTKLKSVLSNSQANERNKMNKQRDTKPEKRFCEFKRRKNLIFLGEFWEGGKDRSEASRASGTYQVGTQKEGECLLLLRCLGSPQTQLFSQQSMCSNYHPCGGQQYACLGVSTKNS